MPLKSIKQLRNLVGKRVLVRVDFNVPIKNNKVMDDTRLLVSLPTLQYLIKKKAKVIIITHLGRPNGKIVSSMKVDPVVKRLSELLKRKVIKLETGNWKLSDAAKLKIEREIEKMKPGQVAIMENTRFSPDEKTNGPKLGQELANLSDIFVQDCFAVAHRPHASIVGPPQYIPSYAGVKY